MEIAEETVLEYKKIVLRNLVELLNDSLDQWDLFQIEYYS